ncbi:hypothetical protein B0I35DRAFT_448834 [Stachybotrys elegans]|uniref:Hexosyltransferase n=1 Tax=Stachybotrys elegans TaxID=80388 RepID=A0A8K0T0K6_9HYPO|nr:hypothetical protein B0I35DRAFT_448834 [Stachybotrys elegans]
MESKGSSQYLPSVVIRCIPKRFLRLFIGALILTCVLVGHLLYRLTVPTYHLPFQPPVLDYTVHDVPVSQYREPAPGELQPFPPTPQLASLADSEPRGRAPWLAAVICPADDAERRMMIRTTWMRLYRDLPMDTRFVVSNPGPEWTEVIRTENRTFGDMIVLDHLPENDITANTVKTLEFYKWLITHNEKYEFVTKMDTDLFLNARAFWSQYLEPRLSNDTGSLKATVDMTMVGQLYYSRPHDLVFPHGSMYTATWDVLETLVTLQQAHKVIAGEDMANALLLMKGHQEINVVNMLGTEKFDFEAADTRGDGSPWARDHTHPNAAQHALVGGGAIAIHQLKDRKMYLKVADCFDEDGIKEMPPPTSQRYQGSSLSLGWHDFWYLFGMTAHYNSQLQNIPSVYWTNHHGDWVCDGIWNLGRQDPRQMGQL